MLVYNRWLWAALVLVGTGCGDDAGSGAGGGSSGTGAGAESSSTLPSSGAGSIDPGDPHTPATGCDDGYVVCGDVCVHVEDDGRHCGGCDTPCSSADACDPGTLCGCVENACVSDAGCPYGPSCDGACVDPSADVNVDHCGSCHNRCGDLSLCVDGACVTPGGDGLTCERPLFWTDVDQTGFRFTSGTTVPHTYRCGPLDAVATRWFRVTTEKDRLRVELDGAPSDDLVMEVFDDVACSDAAHVACANQGPGEPLEIEVGGVTPGTTYWVAVGVEGTSSGAPARLKIDN